MQIFLAQLDSEQIFFSAGSTKS